MSKALRWTSADLDLLPEDNKRYEIVDGDLYVSRQPSLEHQMVCLQTASLLQAWTLQTNLGRAFIAPGVIFADDDDVVPDVVWISLKRLGPSWRASPHLHVPPELAIEVLSPGPTNEGRNREAKLKLYSRRGVDEYWIVDCQEHAIEIYRRNGRKLALTVTLREDEVLESPLLPGFSSPLGLVFAGLPSRPP